jgi:chaperonin cofactor prefoldin
MIALMKRVDELEKKVWRLEKKEEARERTYAELRERIRKQRESNSHS